VVKKSIGLIMFAITRVNKKDKERILETCRDLNVAHDQWYRICLKWSVTTLPSKTREVVETNE